MFNRVYAPKGPPAKGHEAKPSARHCPLIDAIWILTLRTQHCTGE